ncbi:MAG: hypothetical protein ACJ8EN_17570, partial [Xanthobacteraceae bacterium]
MADLSKLVDELSKLTVLEAAELAKMLEDKWGVSAAAAVDANKFISEDNLQTFEGWLGYQGVDP